MDCSVDALIDQVSGAIISAESKLTDEKLDTYASWGRLSWKQKNYGHFKIFHEGLQINLLNCPFKVWCECLPDVPGLIVAARKAYQDRFQGLTPETIQEICDQIRDL